MKKILVIDDDKPILEALKLLLENYGYSVSVMEKDGKTLERELKKSHPDLIILDLLLSGHDGSHICKKLKSNRATNKIPIIMISAHPDAKKESDLAGADDFIAKPFDMEEIIEKIKKLT